MRGKIAVVTVVLFLFLFPQKILAEDYLSSMMEELDLSEVEESSQDVPDKISFGNLVQDFVENGIDGVDGKMLSEYVFDLFFYEIAAVKPVFIQLLCVSLLFALFGKMLVTKQAYVSELGFFVVDTGIILLLLESFTMIGTVVEEGVARIVSFMTAFIPTYATTLLLSGNAGSAGVFYELAFGLIYLLELGIKLLFMPGIHVFVLLMLMDNLFEEIKLSKLARLLEDGLYLLLKLALGVVVGLGVVQSLIAPARDRLATSGIYQGLASIPGVGNTFGATGEILVGCGIMIKNSVGAAALILLLVLCIAPILKVFCFHVMYRFVAALLAPFCDKRIAQSVHEVGRGCGIYLKLMVDVMLLFFITIAMISASTSFIY
jgi:stage III sporulation protein AE